MTDLPKGWIQCELRECVDVLDNRRVPVNSDERAARQGQIPYYGATGQVGWIDDYLFDEELLLIGEDGAPFFDKSKPIAYIINGKTWVNNHAHVLRATADVTSNRYIKHFFDWFDFHDYVNGTTRLKLTQGSMNQIPVLLPPLAEQQRIVAKLEVLLGKVDACRKRLEKIPVIMKRFRQSILAAACSGRLTADWREVNPAPLAGLADGEGLIDLPESWSWRTFQGVSREITVGYVGPMAKEYVERGVPFLRSLNVRPFRFEPANLKYINRDFHQRIQKSRLTAGDVAIVRSGNSGVACVIPAALVEANCSDLVILRVGDGLSPYFACLYLNSNAGQAHVNSVKVGIAQGHFNVGSMKTTLVPLPPLPEQNEIVRRVESLFALADQIETRYAKVKTHVDRLTQSILAKAFRGDLVPQDPNDEPASVLLERIRIQRQGAGAARSQPGRKGVSAARATRGVR